MQFIINHLMSVIGTATILGAAAGWIAKKVPALVEAQVAALDRKLLSNIKNPQLKQFALDVDAAIIKLAPDAADSRYSVLADYIINEVPQAAPARELIIALFSGIGSGARQGLIDAQGQ